MGEPSRWRESGRAGMHATAAVFGRRRQGLLRLSAPKRASCGAVNQFSSVYWLTGGADKRVGRDAAVTGRSCGRSRSAAACAPFSCSGSGAQSHCSRASKAFCPGRGTTASQEGRGRRPYVFESLFRRHALPTGSVGTRGTPGRRPCRRQRPDKAARGRRQHRRRRREYRLVRRRPSTPPAAALAAPHARRGHRGDALLAAAPAVAGAALGRRPVRLPVAAPGGAGGVPQHGPLPGPSPAHQGLVPLPVRTCRA